MVSSSQTRISGFKFSSLFDYSNFDQFLGEHKVHPYENPYVWCCFFAFVGANLVFARALLGKIRIADLTI